jgi:hypothetical protein
MKKIFTIILLLLGLGRLSAQQYNNEWIDFSKTYYKFKVGGTGLYRIPESVLSAAGLGNVQAQNFQLFRNGKEVPIYTSIPTGVMGGGDYIEFWGCMNDGVPDAPLYRVAAYQHTKHLSLETDTAVYFLTVSTAGPGSTFHFFNTPNDTTGNTLTAEPYFLYKAATYFKSQINPGLAAVIGEYVYSSSYDMGEFWSSPTIAPGSPLSDVQNNLYVYAGGPEANLKFGMAGCADNTRSIHVTVNNTAVADTEMDSFSDLLQAKPIPLSLISSGSATVQFTDNSPTSTDRTVSSFYELEYPRQFNFNGQPNFYFELPAKVDGFYLQINNFGLTGNQPVLYDITNGLRYPAIVGGSTLYFELAGSATARRLVLVNEDPSTVTTVTGLTSKNFINFANPANQGNYIIIASPVLYNGSHGNNSVIDYSNYRSSAAGGGFNAHVYDIGELIDQFAFGIKIHPLSIQNFLRYARATFASKPRYVLLMGHSMVYPDYNSYGEVNHDPLADKLDLVPTFGYPASDNKLSADNGAGDVPITPIGRLSVVSGTEIDYYLAKVIEYESNQLNAANDIEHRLWMRNVLEVTGVSEPFLGDVICKYMIGYQKIIADTLTGSNVTIFCDGNATQQSQIPNSGITALFNTGLGIMNYFGHSANQALGYNLDDPQDYSNQGKYPVFYINGCDAGDFFVYDPQRYALSKTLSETYVLAKERGAIAFIASTHFGVVNYLNILVNNLYDLMAGADYGKPIGDLEKDALQAMLNQNPGDYLARLHAEEMTTHGDPYLKLNQQPLPDYDVELSTVQVVPSFISINDNTFVVKAAYCNLGKAVDDSIRVLITRKYPNGTSATLLNKKIKGIYYSDSVELVIPIVATRDKGQNYITVTINPDTAVAEMTRTNNTVTTGFYVYQNEATPVYPYNYAIINTPTVKLVASTANAFTPVQQYVMEFDTSMLFNSPSKIDKFLTSVGGELEFDPGITFQDSVVYYWRVLAVPGTGGQYTWNNASFIYIDPAHSSVGFAQSHYFQHLQSTGDSISMAADRTWTYGTTTHNVYQRNAVYPEGGQFDNQFSVAIDNNPYMQSACVGQSLIFNVINPVTFTAYKNVDASGNNLFTDGSGPANCAPSRNWNFEWSYMTAVDRNNMVKFMDSLPIGTVVTVKNIPFDYQGGNTYPADWKADTAIYGSGNSIYHRLVAAGFTQLDSISFPRAFVFIYKKGDPTFVPQFKFTQGVFDNVTLSTDVPAPYYDGSVVSPKFGPAKQWKQVHWRGSHPFSPATDTSYFQIIGIDTAGSPTVLYSLPQPVQDFDVSAVNASQYPYLQLRMSSLDSVHAKPYQLQYWRINYVPVPEGALAPNILLKSKDSLDLGETFEFAVPFKNVSPYNFDSMHLKAYVIDRSNVTHVIPTTVRKPLVSGDTVMLDFSLDTKSYRGSNTLYVDFNPDNNQPEQYLFNNFLYKNFYVRYEARNPLLDVTFDNVHILNDDIVSAKPHIQIKLQSQSQFLLLTDTGSISVQLRYPDGSMHAFGFNSDTLRFTPATSANNTATVDFNPAFIKQYNAEGDEYQLIVTGKDANGNSAGSVPYRISFKVITKAMISNMLNYPNPFTTSTAFVFTITGSDVPQNIKIQILTITGKIVREITKEELGPLHVGRNITEFKWNGTDMYGARLANGVYLYHVVTNLNGKSLDKYTAADDNTAQYFNNGYGKMYLMK